MEERFLPGPHIERVTIPALLADAATIVFPLWRPKYNAKLRRVSLIAGAAVTGDNTNRKDLELYNVGLLGVGTTQVGVDYSMLTGTNWVAFRAYDLFAPTLQASYVAFAAGEVLTLEIEDNGTSPVFPQLNVEIEFEYN